MLRLSKKLKYLLIISVILLTGCTAKYEITIDNETDLKESLDIIEKDKTKFNVAQKELYNATLREYLETDLKWPTPVYTEHKENPIEPKKMENVDYYTKKDKSTKDMLDLNYSFTHKQTNYSESKLLNECYEYDFNIDKGKINFKTKSIFKCFENYPLLDSVEFALNTTCKISDHNADRTEINRYVWDITKDDLHKEIKFTLNCGQAIEVDNSSIGIVIIIYIAIIVGSIFLVKSLIKIKEK